MVSLEANHTGNVVWVPGFARRRGFVARLAHAGRSLFAVVQRRLDERAQRRLERNHSTMVERARQRRALASMSARDLKDIGITRYDVEIELRKPFWR